MKHLGDTVAAKLSNHAGMVAFGVALNKRGQYRLAERPAEPAQFPVQTLLGDFAEALRHH